MLFKRIGEVKVGVEKGEKSVYAGSQFVVLLYNQAVLVFKLKCLILSFLH